MSDTDRRYRVEFQDNLAILWMNDGENRYNNESLTLLHKALDTIVENSDVEALITVGVGKFYSNGMDLNWLGQQDVKTLETFHRLIHQLCKRILTFPMPTVAAINGHCYAAGGILALCHDFRIMRTKRGWFCLPEVHINRPFEYPMKVLLRHKIPAGPLMRDIGVLGKRYTSEELLSTGMLDGVTDESQLLDDAKKLAVKAIGKDGYDRDILQKMKESVYEDVVEALEYTTLQDQDLLQRRGKLKPTSKL
ncbi:uncharacterized protein [Ptychodera flava]|uniref:uncharacterized protein n=1 Tax=Ptychodera flava TaxID=63121 RepID=UPI00396AAB3F